jgi:hypothetical protein
VRRIVGDLRTLAKGEDTEIEEVDVAGVLDSTLRMASNQLRHRARVVRDYQDVPLARMCTRACGPGIRTRPSGSSSSAAARSRTTPSTFLDTVPNPKLSKPFEAGVVRQAVMEASRKGRRELRAR